MTQLLNKNERRNILDKLMNTLRKISDPVVASRYTYNQLCSFTSYAETLVEILIEDNESRTNHKMLNKILLEEAKNGN